MQVGVPWIRSSVPSDRQGTHCKHIALYPLAEALYLSCCRRLYKAECVLVHTDVKILHTRQLRVAGCDKMSGLQENLSTHLSNPALVSHSFDHVKHLKGVGSSYMTLLMKQIGACLVR